MEIIGTIELSDKPAEEFAWRHSVDGSVEHVPNEVQRESMVKVYVNDILTFQIGCSASHVVELVVGRLLTEGVISGIDEVSSISVCDFSLDAHVYLEGRSPSSTADFAEEVPTCCTNNKTISNYFDKGKPLSPVTPRAIEPADVFAAAHALASIPTMREITHSSHTAFLIADAKVLCLREDIGRHNALDKVVGWGLMQGIDFSQCLLFTTGRMPTDMVRKAIRAGVPAMASKSAATDKAIELAQLYALTLITNVNQCSYDVVTT